MDIETDSKSDLFRALHDANRAPVQRLLLRMVGAPDAEDLTQIVFAKAAKAWPQFRGEAQASTWLYRIAANVASDWLRSRATQQAKLTVQLPDGDDGRESADAALFDIQATPEQGLARKGMQDCIRAEIAHLAESHRQVLILGELGGLSDQEVARTLGISLANTKVKLHRARAQLKKAIAARCEFYRIELSCAPSSPTCCPPAPPSGKSNP
jgi:RNA polymerase sigma-70 factor (ECF subfamily)